MKFLLGKGREDHPKPRKPRSDKRIRSTLRIQKELHEMIKLIAFNHNLSKQKVIDSILIMVLTSDTLRYRLTDSLKKQTNKQHFPYVIIRQ